MIHHDSSNPSAPLTRTNVDGSQQVIVPLAPLNQPLNGSGPQFAVPVQFFDKIRYSAEGVAGVNANTFTQTEPNGNVTLYKAFGPVEYLPVSVTDSNGNAITYDRDSSGKLLKMTDSYGRWLSFGYDAEGRLNAASDSSNLNRSVSFGYDGRGNRDRETDVNGDVTHYVYDGNHRITDIFYPNNGHRTFSYDGQGRVSVESNDNGNDRNSYAYFPSSTTETDALGRVTTYDWTEVQGLRKITKIIDPTPARGITTFAYDSNMNLATRTDALGRTARFQYDQNGNVLTASDPNGGTTQISYEPNFNQPTGVIDPKGNKTQMTYDGKGNLIEARDPLGNMTQMKYDKQGNVTGVKDALGNVSSLGYDGNGALTSVTDPLGRTANMTRDALSRVMTFTDPAGYPTAFTYNKAGDVLTVKDALYLDKETAFAYDPGRHGKLPISVTDANLHPTTFAYDVLGRVTSVTNARKQAAHAQYDLKGRVESVTTRNAQSIGFTYDEFDRLTQMSVGGNSYLGLGYDKVGNVVSANSYNGSALAMRYDDLDRVIEVKQTLCSQCSPITIGYVYDANSNQTRMTLTLGGQTFNFSYGYDALDRLTSVTNPDGKTFGFGYDAAGRRIRLTYPNGIETSYAYDAAGQVEQILHRKVVGNTAIAFSTYAYDLAGNRVGMWEMTGAHGFSYDKLYRLKRAQHSGTSALPIKEETFDYDAVGNRTADAVRKGYRYDEANRILEDGVYAYEHDANGNMTVRRDTATQATTRYAYDNGDRLVRVELPGGTVATRKYDARGMRIEKSTGTDPSQITRYIYDGPRVLAILDGSNNLVALFTNGLGIAEPLSMKKADGTEYFMQADALGNVVALTDKNGAVVETVEYQAFGRPVVKDAQGNVYGQSQVGNPFLYAGTMYDPETGFNHATFRDQDPDTGRWTQEDPIGFAGGDVNFFAYVSNSPTNRADPSGFWSVSIGGYYGPGGGIVFGKNPSGEWFFTLRGGYGYGGGVSFDPQGSRPGWSPCQDKDALVVTGGVFGQIGGGLGPVSAGVNVRAGGYYMPYSNTGGGYWGGGTYGQMRGGWGISGGAYGGVEVSF